jgi:hypothetical protein
VQDPYVGQLVVLRSVWTLQSGRLGIVVEQPMQHEDKFVVMWTTPHGIELKTHIKDALTPVTEYTYKKIKERSCVFK